VLAGDGHVNVARRHAGADGTPIPRHVAIIPDGNGRWASARGLPRSAGHAAGATAALRASLALFEAGVEVVSLFALSTENTSGRSTGEVEHILQLVAQLLTSQASTLVDRAVRVRIVSSPSCAPLLPRKLHAAIADLRARAERRGGAQADGYVLCIALGYGGMADLAQAAREIARKVATGALSADSVDEEMLGAHLATGGELAYGLSSEPHVRALPPVDLLIRTSGEQRLSNFLLWQSAYAELHFAQPLWPDFGRADLDAALRQFARADRRFGRVQPTSPETTECRV